MYKIIYLRVLLFEDTSVFTKKKKNSSRKKSEVPNGRYVENRRLQSTLCFSVSPSPRGFEFLKKKLFFLIPRAFEILNNVDVIPLVTIVNVENSCPPAVV